MTAIQPVLAQLKGFYDALHVGILVADVDLQLVYVNPWMNKRLGDIQSMLPTPLTNLVDSRSLHALSGDIAAGLSNGGDTIVLRFKSTELPAASVHPTDTRKLEYRVSVSTLARAASDQPPFILIHVAKDGEGDALIEANRRLDKARQESEKANRAKSEFIANMSHEIRTPMNAILGFTEILRDQIKDRRFAQYIEAIDSSGKALLRLINDILDLSRIEAGRLEVHAAAVSLPAFFEEIKTFFSHGLNDKNLDFTIDLHGDVPETLAFDEIRLRQILVNLVGNAVKFTDHGGIIISVTTRDIGRNFVELTINVSDTGVGIPELAHEMIFEAFEQCHGHSHADYGGTGLGLSITKRLVETLGGRITVTSEPGRGSVFSVTLPEVCVAHTKPKPSHDLAKNRTNVTFMGATVLVADDARFNRTLLNSYLTNLDLKVVEACNGREAVEKVKASPPDLILMDLKMPIMDGFQAVRALRDDPAYCNIPAIIVTATAIQSDHPINHYCDCSLRKPVCLSDLTDTLIKFLPYTTVAEQREPEDESGDESKRPATVMVNGQERLPLILSMLETEITPTWKRRDQLTFDEIEELANIALSKGEAFQYRRLIDWGKRLQENVAMVDMDQLEIALNDLPHIINRVKSQMTSMAKQYE